VGNVALRVAMMILVGTITNVSALDQMDKNARAAGAARLGFFDESVRINRILEMRANELDKSFAFPTSGGRTVPVVMLADSIDEVSGDRAFAAGRRFVVFEPSRFVIEAPNWRNEIYFIVQSKPDTAKKKDNPEAYNLGVMQAQSAFELRLSAFAERVKGAKRGLMLQGSGVLAPPIVSANNSKTEVKDHELLLGVRRQEITVGDKFRPEWLPAVPVIRIAR